MTRETVQQAETGTRDQLFIDYSFDGESFLAAKRVLTCDPQRLSVCVFAVSSCCPAAVGFYVLCGFCICFEGAAPPFPPPPCPSRVVSRR